MTTSTKRFTHTAYSKIASITYLSLLSGQLLADSNPNIGDLANNITGSFGGLTQLIIGTAYVAGIGFGVAAIFKFKQHKDNPQQVPIGNPITMLAISAALVFLPGIYSPLGSTIFGAESTGEAGGNTGAGASAIPGFDSSSSS